eukprot:4346183-Prymnesium_polylepis.1
MPPARAAWSSQFTFILASVGSAIGFGNIWRFPSASFAHERTSSRVPTLRLAKIIERACMRSLRMCLRVGSRTCSARATCRARSSTA